ncbi:SulP family inorganic anion transporter [Oceanicella sp. SM1341]|uniref:SulP family inorganic anion transporter n=1 Tax=Oceanicella sp. SM1341 TaxID=1548889 RepID=UPI000E4A6F83|nr:SulP family inorganic anion transporter [Oceanicella sp. SM1341]
MDHPRPTVPELDRLSAPEAERIDRALGRQLRLGLRQLGHEMLSRPDWFALVNRQTLRADLLAGLTGATLVLPQGVAFAAIAGLPPEYGFYASIVPTIVTALLGSSWQAVSGATTALSALVFGALAGHFTPGSPEFISAAISMAFLVGVFQILMGVMRLGTLVDFVSHSVMTGFVAGAALLIGTSQLAALLGLELPRPEHPLRFATELATHLGQADPVSLGVGLSTILTAVLARRISHRLPHYLIALLVATLLGLGFEAGGVPLATVGTIRGVIPSFEVPELSPGFLRDLVSGAFAVAFVGLLEAVSIARAMAAKSGQLLNGNKEFIGQGASNLVGSFFHAYPCSASFTRSAVNFESGARTPLAAVFSALILLAILLLVAPAFASVPVAGLAGIIMVVAWRLVDFAEIGHMMRSSISETLIAGVTFLSTIVIDLEFAIYAGVALSLSLFLMRIARPVIAVLSPDPEAPSRALRPARLYGLGECPQLIIASMEGPLYFGTVEATRRDFHRFRIERPAQKHMLFLSRSSAETDLPAAEMLLEESRLRDAAGGSFHLKIGSLRLLSKLARFRVVKALGRDHIHISKREAIAQLVPKLDPAICASCTARVFNECAQQPDERRKDTPAPGAPVTRR